MWREQRSQSRMDWRSKLKIFSFINAFLAFVIVSSAPQQSSSSHDPGGDHQQQGGSRPLATAASAIGAPPGDFSGQNCFGHMHDNAWSKVTVYDSWAAAVNVFVNHSGPVVLTCLHGKNTYFTVKQFVSEREM